MKRLYIHVGNPKTGTTTLQNFFHTKGQVADIQYIKIRKGINHRELWFAIANEAGKPRKGFIFGKGECYVTFSKIAKEIQKSQYDKFLISFEGFSAAPNFKNVVPVLKAFTAIISIVANIKIIYSVRSPRSYLKSKYQSEIRSGKALPLFGTWLLNAKKNILDQSVCYNFYTEIVGEKNVTVVDYDKAIKHKNLLGSYLASMDASLDAYNKSEFNDFKLNQNPIEQSVEKLRIENHVEQNLIPSFDEIDNDDSKIKELGKKISEANVNNTSLYKKVLRKSVEEVDMTYVHQLERFFIHK